MLPYWRALEAIAMQHRDAFIITTAAVSVILCVLWAAASRKRHVILRPSNETEALVLQLYRIAAALERIAARDEIPVFTSDEILHATPAEVAVEPMEAAHTEPEPETTPSPAPVMRSHARAGVGSMFGFTRGPEVPNPFFRPK